MTEHTTITKRRKCLRASPRIWELIRDGYVKGYTVVFLAAHYGPARSTIRKHAKKEGWKRREKEAPKPLPELRAPKRAAAPEPDAPAPANEEGPADLAAAAELIVRDALAAVGAGDHGRAGSLAKVADLLLRLNARAGAGTAGEENPSPARFTPVPDLLEVLRARLGVSGDAR